MHNYGVHCHPFSFHSFPFLLHMLYTQLFWSNNNKNNNFTITMLTRIFNRSFCIFFFCSWPNATYNNEIHGLKNIFGYHTHSNVYDYVRHCARLNLLNFYVWMEVCTELSLSVFFFFFYLFVWQKQQQLSCKKKNWNEEMMGVS